MKIVYAEDNDCLNIKMESENNKELYELIQFGQRINKPVKSFGAVHESSSFVWIKIPMKRIEWKMTSFGNDKK